MMSKATKQNEPLGLRYAHAPTSSSSLPSPYPPSLRSRTRSRTPTRSEVKKTKDGKIILNPQPEQSPNDPLNWAVWRRDAALLTLGLYCMIGGGMTPILAAGFNNVAKTYDVTVPRVALTTGLYMMGMGLGSVVMSPTAILFGKRPVYLFTAVLFIATSIWCGLSPNYPSLVVARIFQGISVSPVECLPSATIAEIFFLHERAYRLGIYTLLLLGGKNLVPLVSAVIIQSLGWRWVFYIVAMIVGFSLALLFFFVPETYWDRRPRPAHVTRPKRHRSNSGHTGLPHLFTRTHSTPGTTPFHPSDGAPESGQGVERKHKDQHAHFAIDEVEGERGRSGEAQDRSAVPNHDGQLEPPERTGSPVTPSNWEHPQDWGVQNEEKQGEHGATPDLHSLNSPYYVAKASEMDYFSLNTNPTAKKDPTPTADLSSPATEKQVELSSPPAPANTEEADQHEDQPQTPGSIVTRTTSSEDPSTDPAEMCRYTDFYRGAPPKSYLETLTPFSGRLSKDPWLRVMIRPFILFCYPAVLWSSVVYSLSIGWLIVLSESVSDVYKSRQTYNFTALQAGLVYLSPFIGGVLGTAVAGKVSDIIVRFMARRNDGIYEPEFRLVMAIPVAISTTIGLMGFGWSADIHDAWIVPTVFFGVISFGCSLGSTTAITFCVDSYRQYAGEALVTLNFSKSKPYQLPIPCTFGLLC
jgi:MFS family permease